MKIAKAYQVCSYQNSKFQNTMKIDDHKKLTSAKKIKRVFARNKRMHVPGGKMGRHLKPQLVQTELPRLKRESFYGLTWWVKVMMKKNRKTGRTFPGRPGGLLIIIDSWQLIVVTRVCYQVCYQCWSWFWGSNSTCGSDCSEFSRSYKEKQSSAESTCQYL